MEKPSRAEIRRKKEPLSSAQIRALLDLHYNEEKKNKPMPMGFFKQSVIDALVYKEMVLKDKDGVSLTNTGKIKARFYRENGIRSDIRP